MIFLIFTEIFISFINILSLSFLMMTHNHLFAIIGNLIVNTVEKIIEKKNQNYYLKKNIVFGNINNVICRIAS